MKEFAELLKAIGSFLWPVLAFAALLVFKKELQNLLLRIRRGKVFGQEIELSEYLDRLDEAALKVEWEAASLPAAETQPTRVESDAIQADALNRIIELSAQSPKAALLMLAPEIEKEMRRLLASIGLLSKTQTVSFRRIIELIQQRGGLPGDFSNSLSLFINLRNRLVHGREASADDILRAIDSGITILRAISSIPHESFSVYNPGVAIYQDQECKQPFEGAKGIILEAESPDGKTRSLRIYPTTRAYFQKGMKVSWEWSDSRTFGKAWYRDPDTGEIRAGWSEAMEFIGRDLDDV